ncbi:uncharacterized protein ARMOST_21952 [Armillaria ostoyae]|uniref:F-box domain-containing protein n=1 Tax=Armillaria ostoyae TaxID=47428 RepID=A0A284SBI2_ARMOS|nr:uncharacterized protein ARMOST_21952 [Armillaria ostoyae]
MPLLDLPQEILDVIIDELQDDKKSLLHASLACEALCPRTRVHLFSSVRLSVKSDCDRLRELITLSPKLALHFTFLRLKLWYRQAPAYGRALTVIESLVNISHLSLRLGEWCDMPATVVASLQSRSYHTLNISAYFKFRSTGEICSLVRSSPGLQHVRFACEKALTEECNLDHSLHPAPAPVLLRAINRLPFSFVQVIDHERIFFNSDRTLMKQATSSAPCPFSLCNIQRLEIGLLDDGGAVSQHIYRYFALSATALKHLFVRHDTPGLLSASSRTLNISGIKKITVTIRMLLSNVLVFQLFEWWISNFSAVDEHCAIRSITFTVSHCSLREPPALDWENLWMRLDNCLASYKMASLKRVAFIFLALGSNALKARIEPEPKNFPELRRLGRKVVFTN